MSWGIFACIVAMVTVFYTQGENILVNLVEHFIYWHLVSNASQPEPLQYNLICFGSVGYKALVFITKHVWAGKEKMIPEI